MYVPFFFPDRDGVETPREPEGSDRDGVETPRVSEGSDRDEVETPRDQLETLCGKVWVLQGSVKMKAAAFGH